MKTFITAIALGYPVGLAALAFAVSHFDVRFLFNQYYLLGTMVLIPATLLSLVVIIARNPNAPKLSSVASLGLWVLIVTAIHLWFISLMIRSL